MRALILAGLATLTLAAQPRVQQFALPNGLRVVHLEDHERPLVRARLHLRVAPEDTPPGRQGLAALALRMVDRGDAAGLKADSFDRLVEEAGIQLTVAAEPGGLDWRLLTRSRDQDRAFGLLADRLLRTVLDPAVLELQRLACWRETEGAEAPPDRRLRRALASGSRPTEAGLGAVTLEDLLVFQARVFRPDRAVLILHGDLGLEQAKRLVLLSLGTWSARGSAATYRTLPAAGSAPPAPPAGLLRLPVPGAALRLQAVADQPDEVPPEAAALLGLLLPEAGRVQVDLGAGQLVATLDAGAGSWALLQERLEALRQRSFSQEDLDRARAAWVAGRALASLDPGLGMETAFAEVEGRQVQAARLQALRPEELSAALRRWLEPARLRTGAVGDPEALKALPAGPGPRIKP